MDRVQVQRKNSIVLASASPRRKDLLRPYYRLKVCPANGDERRRSGETPRVYVKRIALMKWRVVSRQLRKSQVVVAADTTVVLGSEILGKPRNRDHAKRMLLKLSGKTHLVLSAVVVGWSGNARSTEILVSTTRVGFRKLRSAELLVYLKSNQWEGKAGAYAIQGGALKFTSNIVGSLTSVVGLPLNETLRLVAKIFSQSPQ